MIRNSIIKLQVNGMECRIIEILHTIFLIGLLMFIDLCGEDIVIQMSLPCPQHKMLRPLLRS